MGAALLDPCGEFGKLERREREREKERERGRMGRFALLGLGFRRRAQRLPQKTSQPEHTPR